MHPVGRTQGIGRIGRPYGFILCPEIDVAEGEVVARIGGGQPVWEDFPAHMAMFAASIGVVGAEADNVLAARRNKRHAADDGKRHPVFQSAFLPHVCELYNIVPSPSNH